MEAMGTSFGSVDTSIGAQQSPEVQSAMGDLYEGLSVAELEHAKELLAWAAGKGGNLLQQAAQMDADSAAFAGGLADKKEFKSPKEMAEHYNACMANGIAQDQKYFDLYKAYGYDFSSWSVDADKYDAEVKAALAKLQAELKAAEEQRKSDAVKLELRQSISMASSWSQANGLLILARATKDESLISMAQSKLNEFEQNTKLVVGTMPAIPFLGRRVQISVAA